MYILKYILCTFLCELYVKLSLAELHPFHGRCWFIMDYCNVYIALLLYTSMYTSLYISAQYCVQWCTLRVSAVLLTSCGIECDFFLCDRANDCVRECEFCVH